MAVLVCGSLAFDSIMNFEGSFAQQILPAQLHILNVSFLVPQLRKDFGGCAGNIAYGLKLLGGDPYPMAALGEDGDHYLQRLRNQQIRTDYVRQLPGSYTAQAMIMTDRDNNQITAFHPGAMAQAHEISAANLPGHIRLGIVAPDGRDAMIAHAQQLTEQGIEWVFDPGQGLPMFNGDELRHFIEQATWVTVNDYEAQLLTERTGWTFKQISTHLKGLVITLGALGCDLWQDGKRQRVMAVEVEHPADPTGCGDAWRAALLYGLERGWPLLRCAQLGNRVAGHKITRHGPQNYDLQGLELGDLLGG